jgi:hypothetical protein
MVLYEMSMSIYSVMAFVEMHTNEVIKTYGTNPFGSSTTTIKAQSILAFMINSAAGFL